MRRLSLLLALALLPSFAGGAQSTKIEAPRRPAPVVDGTLSEGEWAGALRVPLSSGGELFLQHDGAYLYLAIRADGAGIGSIAFADASGRVSIAHASAALGTAVYERSGDAWKPTKTFTYTNRDTGPGEAAMADRARFLAAERWFANASQQGSTEREFQFDLKLAGRDGLPLAVAFMSFPDEKLRTWPAKLSDDSAAVKLVQGYTPEGLRFDPSSWARVVAGK